MVYDAKLIKSRDKIGINTLSPTVGTDITVPGNQVLTFPVGATPGQPNARQCIFYTVVDDTLVEGQEVFTIAATTTGNFPNGATATFIINDNDSMWKLSFIKEWLVV